MALFNRETRRQHRPWMAAFAVGTAAAVAAYVWTARGSANWPTGSTPALLALGVIGGLLILFEFAIVIRKRLRTWRIFGSAKKWMLAHLWLGLLTVPLAVLHSGFHLGGTLATVLTVVFLLVIASGIYGAVMQMFVPKTLLERVPSETVYSEIGNVVKSYRRDVERLVRLVDREFDLPRLDGDLREERTNDLVVVAAVRQEGRIGGTTLVAEAAEVRTGDADLLRSFVLERVEPFLRPDARREGPLASPRRADVLFDELESELVRDAPEADRRQLRRIVEDMRGLCRQRRDLFRQVTLHRWLHAWLLVHLPLSVALLVLLAAHVWVALLYW